MSTCPACEKPLTIHCASVTCTWLVCRHDGCVWVVYAPRLRRRLNRSGAVESYTIPTPEETP